MSDRVLVVTGALIHLVVLLLPLAWLAGPKGMSLHSPAMWLFCLLMSLFFCVEASASIRSGLSGQIHARGVRAPWLPYITGCAILLVIWVSLFAVASSSRADAWALVPGTLLLLAGVVVRGRAMKDLGRLFLNHVSLTVDHRLMTTGIYRWVRHPSESGLLLICIGASWFAASPLAFFLTVMVLMPSTLTRIRLEDHLLARRFGEQFETYRRVTPSLAPSLPSHWRFIA